MTKLLNIVPEKCTGCMQCELACSWVQTGTFAPSKSLIRVNVFDEEASFSAGPFLLASLLKCPVYLVFGLYTEPNRYDLYCQPFAERIELPRRRRDEALAEYAQLYATRLEEVCRRHPDNWFNFFDFWDQA